MRRVTLILLCLSFGLLWGCGGTSTEQAQQPAQPQQPQSATPEQPSGAQQAATPAQAPAAPAQQPAARAQAPAAPTHQPAAAPQPTSSAAPPVAAAPAAPAPAAVAPVAPPPPKIATVAAGATLGVRLLQALDSSKNSSGDKFEATLDKSIVVDGETVAPRGSVVTGKLVDVAGSGRVKGRAQMSLILTGIKIGDQTYPISTNTLSFEAEGTQKKDAAKVGIGAGLGAAIGAIAGGGKGAAIGAAVGGGAGTATVLATKGKEVTFGAEQLLSFELKDDLKVTMKP
jgi:hypothetical protein